MSAVTELAVDLAAIRRALGVSEEKTIETIVCAVLLARQEHAAGVEEIAKLRIMLQGANDQVDALKAALRAAREALGYGKQGRREDAIEAIDAVLPRCRKCGGCGSVSVPGELHDVTCRACDGAGEECD